jgi:hypothetical protein
MARGSICGAAACSSLHSQPICAIRVWIQCLVPQQNLGLPTIAADNSCLVDPHAIQPSASFQSATPRRLPDAQAPGTI